MSQLRKDLISGRWVIIASERGKRPDDFRPPKPEPKEEPLGFCPFCEGNEAKTPPEVFALRSPEALPNRPGWRVRVVPNKFPALNRGTAPVLQGDGIFKWMEGIGVHEVVIESPDHTRELSDLPLDHIQDILWIYGERIKSIEKELQYRYVHVFKNKGRDAGASLSHPHSQIVATPIIPKKIAEELKSAEKSLQEFGECIFCRIIREEARIGKRIVLKDDHFCVTMPFAPRFPFEMRIYPLRHSAYYSTLSLEEIGSLAKILKTVLSKLKNILKDPPFNYYLHMGPNPRQAQLSWTQVDRFFHWHIEVIPVLTRAAGFEWGTGFYINPVPPETAASFFREATAET